jgi:nucleoside-diphosphate-sugar epimerase
VRKLIFGCGYLGRRVAVLWQRSGHSVWAVTRSQRRAAELRAQSIQPLVADLTQPRSLPDLGEPFDTVLFAVGYDRSAAPTLTQVYVDGLAHVLQRLDPPPGRFIYISSTGVYGNEAGGWIDETTACRPLREGGRACWQAEQLLQSSPLAPQSIVLRLAGLYGPGRIPRRAELESGRPLAAPQEGYLNLIPVDDAAAVVLAAEQRAVPPACYVVADGQPVLRGEYYRELARLLGAAPPRFAAPDPTSAVAERAASSRRVNIARLLRELSPALRFPSYREGLAAIVAADRDSAP